MYTIQNEFVKSRDEKEMGVIIQETENKCDMEGCNGKIVIVKWKDGEITNCCTGGMEMINEKTWKIL